MDVCRTCMNERGSELVGDDFSSIFSSIEVEQANVYIADCLTQWVGCTVNPNDGMPSEICQPCLEAIKSITLFIQNAKECDENLRHILQSGALQSSNDMAVEVKLEVVEDSDVLSDDEPNSDSNNDHRNLPDTKADLVPHCKRETSIDSNQDESDMFDILDEDQLSGQDHNDSNQNESDTVDTIEDDQQSDHSFSYVDVSLLAKLPSKRKRISRKMRNQTSNDSNQDDSDMINVIDVRHQIVCCGCFHLFDNEKKLELHGKTFHEETKRKNNRANLNKTLICKFCFKRFKNTSQQQAHRERMQFLDTVYECKKCNRRFTNRDTAIKHAQRHPEVNIPPPKLYPVTLTRLEKFGYLCCVRKCISSHTSEDALLEHIKNDHSMQREQNAEEKSGGFRCPFCCRSFNSKVKFQYHYINRYTAKTPTTQFQCDQCGKTFKSLSLLRVHGNKHAEVKPYECDVCSKRFYSVPALNQHKLIHTQEKKFICSICGTTFRTKMFLENHYRVHTNDKPFVCDICHKAFRHTSSLFIHKETHNLDKRHKCSECGKGFTDTANLNRHMVTHTGIKPYPCNQCEKRFMRLIERTEHESIVHMGVMPYACEICGKDFASKRPFLKHGASCSGVLLP